MNKTLITSIIIERPHINPVFIIKTDSPQIANTVMAVYNPYSIISDQREDGFQVTAIQKSKTIILQYGKNKTICSVFEAIQRIINIIYELSAAEENYTLIHAAAVAIKDKAFILAGKTQAGKSTLTACLCNIGFDYLTDDIAIIDNKYNRVIPYPKSIMLRESSRQVFINNGISINMETPLKWGDALRYPFLPAKQTEFSNFKIAGLYFIKWNKNELNEIIDLQSGDAFIRLLSSGIFYTKNTISHLERIKAILSAGCCELNYSSLEFVSNLLKEKAGDKY